MTDLPLGLYEQLVTADLERRLRSVDPSLVDRDTLDPVDAHEVLARHVGRLARRALQAAGGDGPDALARQVQLTNSITRAIADLAPDAVDTDDLVGGNDVFFAATGVTDGEMLEGVLGPGGTAQEAKDFVDTSLLALQILGCDIS